MKLHICVYNRKCWCGRGRKGVMNGISEHKHYNRTLCHDFSTYAEADRFAKKKGLYCIGNESIEKVFPQKKQDFSPIIEEGVRKMRHQTLFKGN